MSGGIFPDFSHHVSSSRFFFNASRKQGQPLGCHWHWRDVCCACKSNQLIIRLSMSSGLRPRARSSKSRLEFWAKAAPGLMGPMTKLRDASFFASKGPSARGCF